MYKLKSQIHGSVHSNNQRDKGVNIHKNIQKKKKNAQERFSQFSN